MKLSIITPSYNQAQYIERTIQSVLQQTGDFELEYIIMDGGSKDGSLEIIQRYAVQDARIQWVSEPDGGQSDAINKGLKLASGEVVAYLNSDDYYRAGALQAVAQYFTKHPDIQWLYGQCDIVDEQDQLMRQSITRYKRFFERRYSYKKLLAENFISQPATFWRRSAVEQVGYFTKENHLVMDYEYWLKLGEVSMPGYIAQPLSAFRFYYTSKSGAHFHDQFRQELQLAKQYAAKQHTHWPIWLHQLNYYKITWIYSLLQLLHRS